MKRTREKVLVGIAVLLAVSLLAGCGGVPQEDLDAARAEADAAKAQVASLQSDLDSAESDLNKAKSDLSKAQSDLSAAQSELSAVQGDLETVTAERDAALSDARSAESALSSAQSAADKAKDDLNAAKADLAAVQKQLDVLIAGDILTSFDYDKYTNEDYGFQVQYPTDWAAGALNAAEGEVHVAAAAMGIPGITVTITPIVGTLVEGLSDATDFELVEEKEITLADGSTTTGVWSKWTLDGVWLDMFTISVDLGDGNAVSISVWNMPVYAETDPDQYEEICSTLKFN
jgi:outer membrane murein-binding lipoprotein Lpp